MVIFDLLKTDISRLHKVTIILSKVRYEYVYFEQKRGETSKNGSGQIWIANMRIKCGEVCYRIFLTSKLQDALPYLPNFTLL